MNPAGILLLVMAAAALVQVARLVRRWRRGRPARIDWSSRVPGVLRAYLHDVHDVVARDSYVARMHMLVAGGFLAALVLSLPLHWGGLGVDILPWLVLVAALLSAFGAVMAARRRAPVKPRRLSAGSYAQLPWALAAALVFLAGAALVVALLPTSIPAWALVLLVGLCGLGWLVHQAYGGVMRHAVAGSLHLIVHPRPGRLEGRAETALRPLDLDAEDDAPLGIGDVTDFAWNRLTAFDACVQCGRCEQVCPAFAAGQPLNPKAFINDLVRASGGVVGAPYAGSPHPGRAQGEILDVHQPLLALDPDTGVIDPETLWACTTCRACVEECPMLIEHVDAVVDIRRFATLELAQTPPRVANALTQARQADTPGGQALESRFNWAIGLDLPLMAERGSAQVLVWVGESGFDQRNQKTLKSLVDLLRIAEVDFAVLGAEERDCGDTARRLGDEVTFQRLAKANIETLSRYRFETILTADPHVLHTLSREYPAFGGNYDVQHHSVFLDALMDEGRLRLTDFAAAEPRQKLTFHDPCYLGRYSGEIEAPRRLLDRLGFDRVEMERHGMRSSCCGGGGGAPLSDIAGERRIPDMRMDHARDTGASVLAVGCPNCMNMLEGVVGPRPEVVDLAELLLAKVERTQ